MTSLFIALTCLLLGEDGEVLRFGGQAAVPSRDASPEAPVEVAPRPFKPDAIYRTRAGAWRFYDGARDRVTELAIEGDRLVGWSANGGSVITAVAANRLMRWKVGTWKLLAEMKTTSPPEHTAISPDGHHVIAVGDNPDGKGRRFTLFGGTIGLSLQRLDRPDAVAGAPLALSDERAAIVREGQLEILTLPRLESERVQEIGGDIHALAFGAEGSEILVMRGANDLTIERFTVATGVRAGPAIALPGGCRRGTLSVNGKVAACVLERPTRVVIVDLPSGATRATVPAPGGVDPVLDPVGSRVAFPGNRAVPIWDATADGVLPAAARAGVVKALARGGDGHVVALETSGVVRVWDPATGTETYRVPKAAAAIATIASADGAVLVSAGTPLTGIAQPSGEVAWVVKGSRPIAAVAATDGRVFWLERTGELRVRLTNGKVKRVARAPRGPRPSVGNVPRLELAPDGRSVLVGPRVLDATSGKLLREAPAGLATWAGARVVVASADRVVATGDGGEVVFVGASEVTALASDGGFVAAGDKDGVVHVWRDDGTKVTRRGMHRGPILALVVDAARGRVYSAGTDGVILGTTWALTSPAPVNGSCRGSGTSR